MIEFLPISIGIGLVVSLVLGEFLGLVGAGLIVPGYFALYLTRPLTVGLTMAAGFVTYGLVRGLSSFVIIYGRRRTVLMILLGYLMGMMARYFIQHEGAQREFDVVGFIIPGLIAVALDRWGVIESFCSLLTVAVVTRIILIFLFGAAVGS
jgi:gamma-polyglutamate biosynthesis protein CapC